MSTNNSAAYYRDRYFVTDEDLKYIQEIGKEIVYEIQGVFVEFYDWLNASPDFEAYLSNSVIQQLQEEHWHYWSAFFQGVVTDEYVQQRKASGQMYANIGLPLELYYTTIIAFSKFFEKKFEVLGVSTPKNISAFYRLTGMDTAIAMDTYNSMINQTIQEQNKALMEMSTPVTRLWNGILLLPLVGIIDSKRAQDVMTTMLSEIVATQSKAFILDINGIAMMDTAVANYLIKITKATRLMGCQCIISGISGAVAQTVVELGIPIDEVTTTGNMQDALERSLEMTGAKIIQNS